MRGCLTSGETQAKDSGSFVAPEVRERVMRKEQKGKVHTRASLRVPHPSGHRRPLQKKLKKTSAKAS